MSGPSRARRVAALAAILLSAACTTRRMTSPPSANAVAPRLSVERFLQAANERDLEAMAGLFGTAGGPYSEGQNPVGCFFKRIGSWFGGTACRSRQDVELRMDAIAEVLKHDDYQILRDERVAGRKHPTTRVLVDLKVGSQTASSVPFDVVQTGDGRWVVTVIGLEAAMTLR